MSIVVHVLWKATAYYHVSEFERHIQLNVCKNICIKMCLKKVSFSLSSQSRKNHNLEVLDLINSKEGKNQIILNKEVSKGIRSTTSE